VSPERRPRVVIAGLGDSGLLTAIRLARCADVVGISVKPGLLSGQELGMRLARPGQWARDYWVPFDRYRGLDRLRTVQAELTGIDLSRREVQGRRRDGTEIAEPFDALVISTGVSNGFWRRPDLQTPAEVDEDLAATHELLAGARSVAVIGGGAAAVSAAANVAGRWPDTRVDLYFPGDRPLAGHHRRTWEHLRRRLIRLGVGLHPGHRAEVPDGFDCAAITSGQVRWSTGQPPVHADAVVWAIGRVRPNTGWLPTTLLDERGFVSVTSDLRVPGHRGVFAVGDVAATDPLRSSARNRADVLLAHNIRAEREGRPLRCYKPPGRRWGSVIGPQTDGLEVFTPNGRAVRLPGWLVRTVLMPWVVRRGIYRGVRENDPLIWNPMS
jgi:NADH dehydrogenase FAD-containing subunit